MATGKRPRLTAPEEVGVVGNVTNREPFESEDGEFMGELLTTKTCQPVSWRLQQRLRWLAAFIAHWGYEVLRKLTADNIPPLVGVAAVVERQGQILLIHRSDNLGLSLPGGIVKSNETAEQALCREVREETGYEIAISRLLNVYSGPGRDPRFSSIEIAYGAEIVEGCAQPSVEGQPLWVPAGSLPHHLAFDHTQVVVDYLKRGIQFDHEL